MPGRRGLIAAASLLGLALLWAWATSPFGPVSPERFPSPPLVGAAFLQIATTGFAGATLPRQVLTSLGLVIEGFLVAASSGTALGLAMGWNRRFAAFVNPVFQLLRPIPPLAWIPLVILWLGLGNAAKVLVIWFAAFVPAVINAETGVREIPGALLEAARMLGTPRHRLLVEVVVPAAAPMIFTGLRLCLQATWTTLVAAELVGSFYGLGHVLSEAQQDIYPGMIFVGMAAIGVCGWLTTAVLGWVERRLLGWHASARPAHA
ncbi:MAG: ABC transporter permease [Rhodospirillales bacterium]|nr:ABC transporter permease [Rhodospirillales bacterium]